MASSPVSPSNPDDAPPELPIPGAPEPEMDPAVPAEVGGRGGPDPVRYGDWERRGVAVDF